MTSSNMHVVIAGGGPVGLLSAVTLCQQGVRTTLVERESRERMINHTNGTGFVIHCCSNYILKRVGLYEKAAAVGLEWDSLEMHDAEENVIKTFIVKDLLRKDTPLGKLKGTTTTARFVLAKMFLEELDKYVKKGLFDIHYSSKISGYETIGEERVALLFKKGDEDLRVEGDFLFGCDGVHSTIRRQMMTEMKVPDDYLVDTGITTYWGKIEEDEDGSNTKGLPMDRLLVRSEGTTRGFSRVGGPKNPCYFIWGHGPASAETTQTGIIWTHMVRTSPEKRYESASAKSDQNGEIDHHNRGARKGEKIKQELLTYFAKGLFVEKIARNTDADRVLKTNLLYHNRMEAPYTFGRVCLLGDAAHPMSPAGAQGLNMGLAGAYALPLYLASAWKENPSTVTSALKEYGTVQVRKDINEIAKITFNVTDSNMGANPIRYALLKPMMYFITPKFVLSRMLDKAEELNFDRVYRAEKFAAARGVKFSGEYSI